MSVTHFFIALLRYPVGILKSNQVKTAGVSCVIKDMMSLRKNIGVHRWRWE